MRLTSVNRPDEVGRSVNLRSDPVIMRGVRDSGIHSEASGAEKRKNFRLSFLLGDSDLTEVVWVSAREAASSSAV